MKNSLNAIEVLDDDIVVTDEDPKQIKAEQVELSDSKKRMRESRRLERNLELVRRSEDRENKVAQKKALLLKCLRSNIGNVSKACEDANLTRHYYEKWMKTDPHFAMRAKHINEDVVDFVENLLIRKCEEGDTRAIIFFLQTRAKHRGYSLKSEVELSGSHNVVIQQTPYESGY